jgi:hypothetical protein
MRKKKTNKLTRSERAVRVAQDVIKQVTAGAIIPVDGIYISSERVSMPSPVPVSDWQEVIVQFDKDSGCCNSCAIGAVLLSKIRKFNNCPTDHDDSVYDLESITENHDFVMKQLSEVFDINTLRYMEYVFEGGDGGIFSDGARITSDYHDRVIAFRAKRDNDERKIMIAIMQNIIKNNGKFILP